VIVWFRASEDTEPLELESTLRAEPPHAARATIQGVDKQIVNAIEIWPTECKKLVSTLLEHTEHRPVRINFENERVREVKGAGASTAGIVSEDREPNRGRLTFAVRD
jgi:hypothetical protein